ncbi:hypothetical protein SESBI_40679 [Sesbania bispinosa]|nr:hypothetical protein SESBI_40679 [Sesbania bispinosa]
MGRVSKLHASPLVTLCKERKEIIKAAKYCSDRFVHYGAEAFPISVLPSYDAESQKHGTEQNNGATVLPTPPPPPPPQVSTWDFLYPFSMNYDVPYDHDQDEREVREREGIPDLEDVSEQGSTVLVSNQNEMESGMKHGSGNGSSNVTELNAHEDALVTKNEYALSSKSEEHKVCGKNTEEKIKGNLESETIVQGCESLGTSSDTTPVSSCRMSLKDAFLDIRNEFKYLYDSGKEFSSVIEVGKLPHHSVSTKLRAFASCVLGLIIPSVRKCFYPSYMLNQPAPRTKLLSNADMKNNQEHAYTSLGDLSSTLEKLYVWEKKLHRGVIVEEKLRISYDRKYERLKELDNRGSESDKIDHALASFKLLHSEINVAVASISVISREINELRDNKLLPELNKLIEGLVRLWKVMSTCHQKQFQVIRKAKSHVHILDSGNKKKSSSKATLRLEKVILNWGMCFTNFINTQKTLVKHLSDWLLRHILQKPKETKDGNSPFLPSDIGAPPIFRVCKNWCHAIDKISEIEVSKTISNFASSLHELYKKLEEEQALKVRVEHLSKDYQRKLKTYCKKNELLFRKSENI